MPNIYFLPDEREVETQAAESVLQASLRAGIPHSHACGGMARCSTCRVLILEGLEHCSPVGEEKKIAILFADINGYTPFAEALPPYDVIHVLSRYFHLMGKVITRRGGCISDYIGDGIMALFGVDNFADAALRAVKAGVEMLVTVERLNPYLETMYKKSFQIRIGVHYGEVVVGTIGVANMKKTAAIGDAVNFASRIEAANKETGTKFLISEDTYQQVRDHIRANRCSIHVTLRGKSGEYLLYEVIGLNEPSIL